jgi:hypothetical protein
MNGFWLILIVFGFIILLIKGFEGELEKFWNFVMKFFNTYHEFVCFGLAAIFDTIKPRTDAWYKKKIEEFNALK